jgi:hypothetical protein
VDPSVLEKAFYRWRSDTIRLLSYIKNRTAYDDRNEIMARITEEICTSLLARLPISQLVQMELETSKASLDLRNAPPQDQDIIDRNHQETPSQPSHENGVPIEISQSQTKTPNLVCTSSNGVDPYSVELARKFRSLGMNEDHVKPAIDALTKKVSDCVAQAIYLYSQMRCCRPNYMFSWVPKGKHFNPNLMKTFPPSDFDLANQTDCKLIILFCKSPGIWKYGDDDGNNYNKRKLVAHPKTIVDGQLARSALKTVQHQDRSAGLDGGSQELGSSENSTPQRQSYMQRLARLRLAFDKGDNASINNR